jgi:hypothetical protein
MRRIAGHSVYICTPTISQASAVECGMDLRENLSVQPVKSLGPRRWNRLVSWISLKFLSLFGERNCDSSDPCVAVMHIEIDFHLEARTINAKEEKVHQSNRTPAACARCATAKALLTT